MIIRSPEFLATSISLSTVYLLYLILRERKKVMTHKLKKHGLNPRLRSRIIYQFSRNLILMSRPRKVELIGSDDLAGTLGVSIHFGPWELIGPALVQRGIKFGAITRSYGDGIDTFLKIFRSGLGIKTFYSFEMLKIKKFLKGGGMVGMMMDGNTLWARLEKARRLASVLKVKLRSGIILPINGQIYLITGDINFEEVVREYPEHYAWFYIAHS